jgi:hypothetical protein
MGTLRARPAEPTHYTVPRRRAAKKLPGGSGLIGAAGRTLDRASRGSCHGFREWAPRRWEIQRRLTVRQKFPASKCRAKFGPLHQAGPASLLRSPSFIIVVLATLNPSIIVIDGVARLGQCHSKDALILINLAHVLRRLILCTLGIGPNGIGSPRRRRHIEGPPNRVSGFLHVLKTTHRHHQGFRLKLVHDVFELGKCLVGENRIAERYVGLTEEMITQGKARGFRIFVKAAKGLRVEIHLFGIGVVESRHRTS